jgi:hypothetical protein
VPSSPLSYEVRKTYIASLLSTLGTIVVIPGIKLMLCDNPDSQEIENGKSMEKNGMRKCFIIFEKMEKF